MYNELKNNFGLSDKMNTLIREIVKTAIEEGYSVATIKNVILEEFKTYLNEGKLSDFEIKLFELFEKVEPRCSIRKRKQFAMICSTYYNARESERCFEIVRLGEIASVVAKRLGLKEDSIKSEIRSLSYFLKCNFLDYTNETSKEILEAFYQKYMKNM